MSSSPGGQGIPIGAGSYLRCTAHLLGGPSRRSQSAGGDSSWRRHAVHPAAPPRHVSRAEASWMGGGHGRKLWPTPFVWLHTDGFATRSTSRVVSARLLFRLHPSSRHPKLRTHPYGHKLRRLQLFGMADVHVRNWPRILRRWSRGGEEWATGRRPPNRGRCQDGSRWGSWKAGSITHSLHRGHQLQWPILLPCRHQDLHGPTAPDTGAHAVLRVPVSG
mmetsp:Transcript_46645/g.84193  ORF Transcript_46645/g.84193 Transcript_46645/m.84193 type:complete len:219 (+) Transcript_46645:162-818(+)